MERRKEFKGIKIQYYLFCPNVFSVVWSLTAVAITSPQKAKGEMHHSGLFIKTDSPFEIK